MSDAYQEFLKNKQLAMQPAGFDPTRPIQAKLFDFQKDIVRWGLRKGKCAFFEDCGLGKTAQQLVWGDLIHQQTNRPVLAFAPLAVSQQTQREGVKFDIPVTICRQQADVSPFVNVANYEMLRHFDPREFGGIVLDESSILKGDGPMRVPIGVEIAAIRAQADTFQRSAFPGPRASHVG
jgi:hypothetical protein